MKSSVSILICLIGLLILGGEIRAQNAPYLQGLYVASEGTAALQAEGADEDLGKFHDQFTKALGLRPKAGTVIAFSAMGEKSVFLPIGALQGTIDQEDVLVSVVLGGWARNQKTVELSALLAKRKEQFTVDYIFNMMLLMPAKNMLVFVLAPSNYAFPAEIFQGQRSGVAGGGKYLIVVQQRKQSSYASAVGDFHDLLSDLAGSELGDLNKDGNLSFAEWIALCQKQGDQDFTILPYKIIDGPDIPLRQIR